MLSVENGFAELVKKHEAQEARLCVTHRVHAAGRLRPATVFPAN